MSMFQRRSALALAVVFALSSGCSREPERGSTIAVAAAANLTEVLTAAGSAFEAKTGIHPVISFASTSQLEQQIENAAPYDVFLAADASHVEKLEQKHLLAPNSKAVYAIGVLALWIPPSSPAAVSRIQDLASPSVRTIAIANPQLAPYGQAAVETLKSAGIWDQVQSKIVYAENISMARQYGDSGNADAVFTAYSLVLKEAGTILQVDEKLHQPIQQELGVVAASTHQSAARKFTDFLLKGAGKDLLRQYGYRFPSQ